MRNTKSTFCTIIFCLSSSYTHCQPLFCQINHCAKNLHALRKKPVETDPTLLTTFIYSEFAHWSLPRFGHFWTKIGFLSHKNKIFLGKLKRNGIYPDGPQCTEGKISYFQDIKKSCSRWDSNLKPKKGFRCRDVVVSRSNFLK